MNSLPYWKPGDEVTADGLNAPRVAIRANSLASTGPASVRRTTGRTDVSRVRALPIIGLLSGASSPYSFTQQVDGSGGTWATGPLTGSANAYEVNGVAGLASTRHRLYPDGFGAWRFQSVKPAPDCASATITAVAKCNGAGADLTSVTFDLRDDADTTTLATQTGTTATFSGLDGTLSYKVRVTKTGYHTKTSSTITPGCGGMPSVTVSTWPETATLSVNVFVQNTVVSTFSCAMPGASVALSGAVTDAGTTGSGGNVTFTVATSSSSPTQSITVSFTGASGGGASSSSQSITFAACSGQTLNVTLAPDSSHVAVVANNRYLSDTFDYVDDYGSCSLGWTGAQWEGGYTYTTTNGLVTAFCGPTETAFFDSTGDVEVFVSFGVTGSCSTSVVTGMNRGIPHGVGILDCANPLTIKCQPFIGGTSASIPIDAVSGSVGTAYPLSWSTSSAGISAFLGGCPGYIEDTPQTSIQIDEA